MGLPAALMANFIAWREERQILLPQGGIRMTCHSEHGWPKAAIRDVRNGVPRGKTEG